MDSQSHGHSFSHHSGVMLASVALCMQVTVSTVGLVPQLRHFVQNSPAQLAVSLHATTDEVC